MLIIYAHPNREGHCGFILSEVEQKLKGQEVEYEVLDLYEVNYDPVLKPEEHYTSGNRKVSDENKRIQEMIKKERRFIFIYPTWWNGAPAILKGFIDRVFTSGFAFIYEEMLPEKLLQGKAVVFTSIRSPRIIGRLYFKDSFVKFLTRDVLGFCGIKTKGFVIDRAYQLTEQQKKKISKKVFNGLWYLQKT